MTKFRHEPGVTELRIELKAAGYSPIPLVGKIPPSAGWPTMTDSEDAIRMWPTKYSWATNTGIKTRNTPAIDVDITDVARMTALFGQRCTREAFRQKLWMPFRRLVAGLRNRHRRRIGSSSATPSLSGPGRPIPRPPIDVIVGRALHIPLIT